mgnify:CR=1 FL=1
MQSREALAEKQKHFSGMNVNPDKNIVVIKTKAVTESISAMVMYQEGASIEDVTNDMNDAIANVRTAEITYAVRDTKSNGKDIQKGDIIGILDGEIKVVGKTYKL